MHEHCWQYLEKNWLNRYRLNVKHSRTSTVYGCTFAKFEVSLHVFLFTSDDTIYNTTVYRALNAEDVESNLPKVTLTFDQFFRSSS